jgi:iron complex outermembrane recepter protein
MCRGAPAVDNSAVSVAAAVQGKLDNGDKVPRIPPLRYGARLAFHTGPIVVGLVATKYDRQDDVALFEEPTDGYTLVTADFDWTISRDDNRDISFFVRGSNLCLGAPLLGRNFAAGVGAMFSPIAPFSHAPCRPT